jgi:acyl-CoA reductase-like NAD-dependent aldehyde dehydrogenase
VLVAMADKVGLKHPYSMEKLCPVLALFVEENENAVLQRSLEILHFEGRGHTFSIHTEDKDVIRRFALEMPVSRFLVNTPAALGGIGYSTGLFPALTLGCGAVGGSSSSNNISPMDLLDVRQVAWGVEEENHQSCGVDDALVEKITAMILEKLK